MFHTLAGESVILLAISTIRAISFRRKAWVFGLYAWALVREFKGTLLALALVQAVGTLLYLAVSPDVLDGRQPTLLRAVYAAWMALFAQPVGSPAECWYIAALAAIYPVIGFIILGEGIVRFALLMISRRQGEKEWTMVTASTYRNHVILCGLGHLGYRILQQLVQAGVPVVAIEKDADGRFVAQARETQTPILIRDMKEDQAIIDAGIRHARSIIIATNDDLANLEVALDARKMNPGVHILLRMFDQQVAAKLSGAMTIDTAFSASSLAAPIVAAMSQQAQILGHYTIAGVPHVTAQVSVGVDSHLVGHTIADVERDHGAHVLAHNPTSAGQIPSPTGVLVPGDMLVLHVPAERLATISAASQHAA